MFKFKLFIHMFIEKKLILFKLSKLAVFLKFLYKLANYFFKINF